MFTSIPTLADVAKAAGVSTATVSRCINEPDLVSEEKRNLVLSTIKRLNYAPNHAAKVMVAKRSKTIGAVIPTMDNAIFSRTLQVFQEELDKHGYTLLLASSGYDLEQEEKQIRTLVARGADGLLLLGLERDPRVYSFLETQNVPVLATWAHSKNKPIQGIGFDNARAMAELAQRVFELGHRNVGMISAITRNNDRAHGRVEGMIRVARDYGVHVDTIPIIETRYSVSAAQSAFVQLMKQREKPTCVFCGNDVLAAGAIIQAQKLGLSVPNDISITGFDDIELAGIVGPGITTVHVPHKTMGRAAARNLIRIVEGGSSLQIPEMKTYLVERASLAEVPLVC